MKTMISKEIDDIRAEWGTRLIILGHHYQRASVLQHADERGDSLELARKAAAHRDAERIVFCGVHFMAESADILTSEQQAVYMPETAAGCPMADMADLEQAEQAWRTVRKVGDDWLPICYVNSTAEIKAFCGRHGGSACTSSNAAAVFRWALDQGRRILFLPDEHLGVNTAFDLGLPTGAVAVYDPSQDNGGLSEIEIESARVVVWKGFCLVHTAFAMQHIAQVREKLPDARIIVHPETPREVVAAADAHGSTAQIIKYVEAAEDGATIVIGTEVNLVTRLAEEHRGRVTVKALSPSVCANMARTNESGLLAVLKEWPARNIISVDQDVAVDARKALETMLSL